MPLSDDDFGFEEEKAGQNLAVLAEALYLINLLLLPGLAFALLLGLWLKYKGCAPPLARQHLKQTTFVSLVGGLLIVTLSGLILALGPFQRTDRIDQPPTRSQPRRRLGQQLRLQLRRHRASGDARILFETLLEARKRCAPDWAS